MKIKTYDMLTLFRLAKKARDANLPALEKVQAAYVHGELEIDGLKTWRRVNFRDGETLPKEGTQLICRLDGKNVLGTAVCDEFGLISIDIGDDEKIPLKGLQWLPIPD
jgi:hypothetical protein